MLCHSSCLSKKDIWLHAHPIYQSHNNTLLSDLSEICFFSRLYIICVYEWHLVYIYSAIWCHITRLADLSLPTRCFVFRNVEERERERGRSWIRVKSDTSSLAMSMRPDWTCFSFPLANQNMQGRQDERQSYFGWIITCDCYIVVALPERTRTVSLLNLTMSWSPGCLWRSRFEDNVFLKQMSLIKILQQTICFLFLILFSSLFSPLLPEKKECYHLFF